MISKTGMHALRAMTYLALLPPGEFAGAKFLAAKIEAPRNYLGKLLQTLAGSGLLESRKGLGGGFRLARDPASISLLAVLDSVDSISNWEGCFLGLPICSDTAPCAVHNRWAALRDEYLDLLSNTSIHDVVMRFREAEQDGTPENIDALSRHLRSDGGTRGPTTS